VNSSQGLGSLIATKSLIVCVGPGGVGKTTIAAAVALAGAKLGRRTVVLTVDPARRLADALGLPGLDDEIRSVPLGKVVGERGGLLDAAMVDTAQSYASLIRRIAPDEGTRERIVNNRVYQAVTRSMARSHAYIAMERLYDAMELRDYELVVLDTPPARNALDILDAPEQLARFLDTRFVEWFLPGDGPKGLRDRLLATGGRVAKSMLALITGQKLLDEIVEFLDAFATLREGFLVRAARTAEILRAPTTSYTLVSSASPASADDAAWLLHDLERRTVPIAAVVFNQSYVPLDPRRPERRGTPPAVELSTEQSARLRRGSAAASQTLDVLRRLRREAADHNARLQRIVEGMAAELPEGCARIQAPRFDDEIRDLPGLLRLANLLIGE